jgi:hypothetical protein
MDHLVAEYKYTILWQLKRSFAKGRDEQLIKGKLKYTVKIYLLIVALLTIPYLFILNAKYLFSKKIFIENYILDSMRYSIRLIGKISV